MSLSVIPTWELLPYMELWLHITALSGLPTGTREAFSAVEDDRDRHAGPWGLVSASQPQQALSSPLHRGLCHLRYCWASSCNWQQVILFRFIAFKFTQMNSIPKSESVNEVGICLFIFVVFLSDRNLLCSQIWALGLYFIFLSYGGV